MTNDIRVPAGRPTGGQFAAHARTDADIALDRGVTLDVPTYMDVVLAEVAITEDVDAIAKRDGWSTSQWERYYDARGRGDNCPDCGTSIDENNSTDDGVCFDCAYPDEERDAETGDTCRECGDATTVTDTGVSHHVDADGEINHDADADHVALPDTEDAAAPEIEQPTTPTTSDRFLAAVVEHGIDYENIATLRGVNGTAIATLRAPAAGGYTEVRVDDRDGVTFLRDGVPHRTDGYAIDNRRRTGLDRGPEAQVWFRGVLYDEPFGYSFDHADDEAATITFASGIERGREIVMSVAGDFTDFRGGSEPTYRQNGTSAQPGTTWAP